MLWADGGPEMSGGVWIFHPPTVCTQQISNAQTEDLVGFIEHRELFLCCLFQFWQGLPMYTLHEIHHAISILAFRFGPLPYPAMSSLRLTHQGRYQQSSVKTSLPFVKAASNLAAIGELICHCCWIAVNCFHFLRKHSILGVSIISLGEHGKTRWRHIHFGIMRLTPLLKKWWPSFFSTACSFARSQNKISDCATPSMT